MAHDEHMAALTDELHQGVGGNPGANLAAVVRLGAAAAVEGEVQPVLNDRLVAAPAQGHFNAQGREVIALLKIRAVHAQANGDGSRQSGGADHLMDLLQQRELILGSPLQIPLLEDEQEPVALELAQQSVVAVGPFGNGVTQLGVQGGDGVLRQVLGQLLIVVNEDDGYHRPGADIFVPNLVQFRQIAEIQDPQHGALAVLGPDGSAVDPIAARAQRHILGALGFSGGQPVRAEAGKDLIQILLHHGIGIPRQLAEAVIGPDDAAVSQPGQHRRQRALPPAGGLQGVGSILNILLNLTVPPAAVHDIGHEHQQRHTGLPGSQPILPRQQRCRAERRHNQKIQSHSGP